jgi:hypothetical protein
LVIVDISVSLLSSGVPITFGGYRDNVLSVFPYPSELVIHLNSSPVWLLGVDGVSNEEA